MSEPEDLFEGSVEAEGNNIMRDDDGASSCSSIRCQDVPSQGKIRVEYESVGSFQVFETICPLEFYGKTKTVENEMWHRKSKRKSLKGRKCKKNIKTITIADDLATESGEDLIASLNPRLMNASERSAPVSFPITLDAFFRSENPMSREPIEGEATVFWARGDSVKISGHHQYKGDETDSDVEPDIESYIRSQKEKRRSGENVTGENLWYDQERSIIRNLHTDGSISLTSYGDTDEKIFGKTEIFDAIMTCEERAMLRARNTDTTYMKVEKKKKISEANKKGKKIRPKDQGDWL
jgi:hypothetical protein